ncbi:ABC transporter (plasmid) [Anabaena sp. WA102]|jgi:putative ABC transport system ATP-binding protein|uniref:DevA family ABC transporter ATP-binding protein n=1 Tax=Anabaena sp. WA102 TaxID=1647413 RepID=UPI0006AC5156|nr:DevA family ABC transporter ATP-binding protein [Anabaena sp. WA102]ALB43732.1 ABC transporter [Anabaena sp. WA102]OBQ40844.1 MAG: ABC transporter [Anabaena sp. MDT14b]
MNNKPIIEIENLEHFFGQGDLNKQILFNINFKVYPGEITIMEGPSGSGKTTLLTLIGGLRSVQTGSLKVLGQELLGSSEQKLMQTRRYIGYIFQSHNLLRFLTAKQNVEMSLELHDNLSRKEIRERSVKMLTDVGLGERIDSYPENLSGGQKQRVAIARALASQPKLVLADEPTASLDKYSGRAVVELMQKLAKHQGCSILIVTHDNRILDIADRIIKMEDGHLSEELVALI